MSHSYPRLVNNQPDPLYGRLFEPRLPVEASTGERPIKHLVVVAGARGAGKSTLIEMLVKGGGHRPLRNILTQGAGEWPFAEALGANGWLDAARQGDFQRMLMHYDLVRLTEFSPSDRALESLLIARRITVVTIKPRIDRLASQVGNRQSSRFNEATGNRRQRYERDASGVEIHAQRETETGLRRDHDWRAARQIEKGRRNILACYAAPHWLTTLYGVWDELLSDAAKAGANLRAFDVELANELPDPPAWRPINRPAS